MGTLILGGLVVVGGVTVVNWLRGNAHAEMLEKHDAEIAKLKK